MKKVKIILWLIIIGLFGLVVFQNQDFFFERQHLDLNLYFAAYKTVDLPSVVLFIGFFFIGWLIAYVFGLAERYRSHRAAKNYQQTIDTMRRDLESLKMNAAPSEYRSGNKTDLPNEMPDPLAAK